MNPRDVENNLLCAKFAKPDIDWVVLPDGKVVANPFRGEEVSFDLNDRLDRQATRMKLVALGWKIIPTTRDGQPAFKAVKEKEGLILPRPTLIEAIVAAVEMGVK